MKDKDTQSDNLQIEALKTVVKDLQQEIDMLTKQKELLQFKCREAGATILKLEQLIKELKRDNTLLSMDVATITDRLREAGL
jgi:peptidoglycan hydrolase CwlO-like protein|tara:strand:+ start:203 stop:448 length:246 start_codon:yes stop_codon:yes gene_type:complete